MTDRASFAVLVAAAMRHSGIAAPTTSTISFAEALETIGMLRPDEVFAAAEACFCKRREDRETVAQVLAAVMANFDDPGSWRTSGEHVLVGAGGLSFLSPPAGGDQRGADGNGARGGEDGVGEDDGSAGGGEDGGGDGSEDGDGADEHTLLVTADGTDSRDERGAAHDDEDDPGEAVHAAVIASAVEVLRQKDFGACSEEELAEVARLIPRLEHLAPLRRDRRMVVAPAGGRGIPDLRRTVRRNLPYAGELVSLSRRRHGKRARRVVLLLDVSGSMAPYARALLGFAHAAVVGGRRVEAFLLATRCTRVTRQLSWRDPTVALVRAERSAPDMSGGTRLGEGLRRFNDEWGTAGMARGAVVVVCSDGWDRGDPHVLAAQMARLSLVAHRVVWVNPLKSTVGYEPLARGMAAALPYVDQFVSGHTLQALEELARVIAA